MKKTANTDGPVIIKKYANRRLYNTETSSYITLDHLAAMTREGRDFKVIDAKTEEDITHNVLTQIIMEEEARGQTLLPVNFLRQLIALYGDSMQAVVPGYLERPLPAPPESCEVVSRTTGVPIPPNYPVVGRDAFRTATGVHAAAIIKFPVPVTVTVSSTSRAPLSFGARGRM